MDTSNQNIKLIDQLTDEIAKKISRFTVQIYEHVQIESKYKTPFQSIGTGVLLYKNNRHFLVTAGHVIKDRNPFKIGFLEIDMFYNFRGDIFYIDPDKNKISENADIAIWELDSLTVNSLLEFYDFLSIDKLQLNHASETTNNYLFFGFPWRKTHYNPIKQKLKVIPYKFLTCCSDDKVYSLLKVNPISNLIFECKQRAIIDIKTGKYKRIGNLEGISGCGIWYLPKLYTSQTEIDDCHLIGIIFKQDLHKNHLIAIKIDFVLLILMDHFKI